MSRTVTILAGGESTRFRRFSKNSKDKALKKLNGKTLLENILSSAREAAEEVVITVNNEQKKKRYEKTLSGELGKNTKILVDEKRNCSGPLRGIVTGLKNGKGDLVLTLPCDVPLFKTSMIEAMFSLIGDRDAVVPTWPDGNIEPLIGAFKPDRVFPVACTLCLFDRSRPDDLFRSVPKVGFISIEEDLRPHDDNLESFVNINYPSDLEELSCSIPEKNDFTSTIEIDFDMTLEDIERILEILSRNTEDSIKLLEDLSEKFLNKGFFFWGGVIRKHIGKKLQEENLEKKKSSKPEAEKSFRASAKSFEKEASFLKGKNLLLLSAHALEDSKMCWEKLGNKKKVETVDKRIRRIYSNI